MTGLIKYTAIKEKYGNEVVRNIKCLEKLSKSLGRYNSHHRYNLHCKHNDVIPTYAKIKAQDDIHEVREILHKAEKAILNVHITIIIKKKESIKKQIQDIRSRIQGTVEQNEYETIIKLNAKAEGKEFNRSRDRQKKKFNAISTKKNNDHIQKEGKNSKKWIKNISSIELTPDQEKILKKGGNFAITPTSIPKEDYIVAIEQASKMMSKGEAAAMRAEITEIIRNEKVPESNITKGERRALKELKNNNNIIIAPADKGRCIVIMDRSEYIEKMEEKLKDESTYKLINNDPTKEIQTKLKEELQSMKDNKEIDEKLYLKLYPNKTQIPIMYGQPKIHKINYPLREIVDGSGSVTRDINRYISQIIKPYANNEYTIKNSKAFIEIIKDVKLEEDETLVSFDVKAMYPSIPQGEAISIIKELLHNDENLNKRTPLKAERIVTLLTICLENTYFMFNKKLYNQVDGLAIGACTSGFAADIFMYRLEKKAINTFTNPPSIWGRYVDDTIAKLKKDLVEQFLEHLNNQHRRLEFTAVEMKDKKLEFLDTRIHIQEDGNIKTTIYKKPTHTDQYLMFESNHHIGQKLGIVSTLKHRIGTLVTTEEDKEKEKDEMKEALTECGYPQWTLDRKKKENKDNAESRGRVVLTYVKGTSEKIAKVLKKYNIQSIHKPKNKLKNYVCNMKEKIHPLDKVGAVYEVKCTTHDETYTGETSRAMKSRGYEHRVVTHKESEECHSLKKEKDDQEKNDDTQNTRRSKRKVERKNYKELNSGTNIILSEGNTVVSKHMATQDHKEGDITFTAITFDENWYTRGIREAIEIKKTSPTLNEDQGRYYLSAIYDNILVPKKDEVTKLTGNSHTPEEDARS